MDWKAEWEGKLAQTEAMVLGEPLKDRLKQAGFRLAWTEDIASYAAERVVEFAKEGIAAVMVRNAKGLVEVWALWDD